jgi:hypothetical protein
MSKLAGVYGSVARTFEERFYGFGSKVRPDSIAEVDIQFLGVGSTVYEFGEKIVIAS